ncbi:hypothetical protein [Nesterenkonia muleiensis]|nr:hypothetical protein [Nesterenkonia muleiensis]
MLAQRAPALELTQETQMKSPHRQGPVKLATTRSMSQVIEGSGSR